MVLIVRSIVVENSHRQKVIKSSMTVNFEECLETVLREVEILCSALVCLRYLHT